VTGVAVGVISWNTRDLLRACLASVLHEGADQLVVVDNGSRDGSVVMVAREFPGIAVAVNPANPGFGAAANQVFGLTAAPYVLVLNGDTQARPRGLRAIADYLDRHPRVGVLGPRLIHPDGRLQSSCSTFPHPLLPLVKSKRLTRVVSRLPVLRDRHLDTWKHDRPRKVPWVVGAALAIRRSAFQEVGGFDESFHLYFEEPDLCYRMLKAGWETHFAPVTDVVHVEGASTQQRRNDMLWEWAVSYMHYNERHLSGARLAAARATFRLGMRVRWVRESVRALLAPDPTTRAERTADAAVWVRALGLARRK
jgi:GT2 family glycosyltransferase